MCGCVRTGRDGPPRTARGPSLPGPAILPPPEKPRHLPVDRREGYFIVVAGTGGPGPSRLLLDAGAIRTLLDPSVVDAARSRLHLGDRVIAANGVPWSERGCPDPAAEIGADTARLDVVRGSDTLRLLVPSHVVHELPDPTGIR